MSTQVENSGCFHKHRCAQTVLDIQGRTIVTHATHHAMSACSYRTTDCRYEDTAVNENHMNNGKRISLFESSESIYFTIEDRELQRRSVTNDPAADDIVSISAMKNLSKTSSQFSPAPRCPCKQDNVATHMTKFEDASCDKHSDQSHGMFPSRSKQSSKSQESMSMFLRHEDTRSKEELQEENKNELNSIENACVCHSSESLYFTIDDVDDDECKPRTVENLNSQCGVKSVDNLYAKAGRGEICTNQSSIPPEQPKISETRTADSMSSVGAKHVHSAVDINAPSTESLYEISTLAVSSVDLANDHDAGDNLYERSDAVSVDDTEDSPYSGLDQANAPEDCAATSTSSDTYDNLQRPRIEVCGEEIELQTMSNDYQSLNWR